jgi:hypothetical protein
VTTGLQDRRVNRPKTRYAKTEHGVHIGYQVFGEGSNDQRNAPGGTLGALRRRTPEPEV